MDPENGLRFDPDANGGAGAWTIDITAAVPSVAEVSEIADTLPAPAVPGVPPPSEPPHAEPIAAAEAAPAVTRPSPAVAPLQSAERPAAGGTPGALRPSPISAPPSAPRPTTTVRSAPPRPRRPVGGFVRFVVWVSLLGGGWYWGWPAVSQWWQARQSSGSSAAAQAEVQARVDTVARKALALSADTAASQLAKNATRGNPSMDRLRNAWVPQLSSKCTGIPVDIGPNWVPDGTAEVRKVTAQQILAYQLTLTERFGAVTITPKAIGIARDKPTTGVCKGKITWMSIFPTRFSDASSANAWCARQGWPVGECQARLVAAPGSGASRAVPRT